MTPSLFYLFSSWPPKVYLPLSSQCNALKCKADGSFFLFKPSYGSTYEVAPNRKPLRWLWGPPRSVVSLTSPLPPAPLQPSLLTRMWQPLERETSCSSPRHSELCVANSRSHMLVEWTNWCMIPQQLYEVFLFPFYRCRRWGAREKDINCLQSHNW